MTPMMIQMKAASAALPWELMMPAAVMPPIVIDPSASKIAGQEWLAGWLT